MRKTFSATLLVTALLGCSALPGTEAHQEKLARQLLMHTLSDPNSAQFANLVGPMGSYADGAHRELCGEVNAKNEAGGYTGFRRFAGALSGLTTIEPDASDPIRDVDQKAFNEGWRICHPEGRTL